jgi:hypothetical protein
MKVYGNMETILKDLNVHFKVFMEIYYFNNESKIEYLALYGDGSE